MRLPRRLVALMAGAILVFGVSFGAIAIAVNQSGNTQRQIREAQEARASVLRLQLDQETSVRGFTSTDQRAFLGRYGRATPSFDPRLELLRTAAARLAVATASDAIADLQVTHQRWMAEVAEPLVADPKRDNALALQLRGKQLIDRFRDDNDVVSRGLDGAAADADLSLRRLVNAIIAIGVGLGVGLLGLMLWITDRQHKLERQLANRHELEEQLVRQRLLLAREHEIANSLQAALLARELPVVPGLALHARYRAAEEPMRVGGDWFDAFALADGRVFITVGDVTGHGIEATAMMSRVRHAIVAAALHQNDPATILSIANRGFRTVYTEPVVGTVVCAFVDPITREIIYATAGHPPPVLVNSGTATFLKYGGTPLGVDGGLFHTHVAHAIGNALLIFYTDGLIEATGDIIEGEARLVDAAQWVAGAGAQDPAAALKERILGNASPHDDIAILTVAFSSAEPVTPTIESDGRASNAGVARLDL